METEKKLLTCYLCGGETILSKECHFCHNLVCREHTYHIGIPDRKISGVSTKTIMVCTECKPKGRVVQ